MLEFLSKKMNNRGKKKNIDQNQFLKEFSKHMGLPLSRLGVKINGLGFPIVNISRVLRVERQFFEKLKREWKNQFKSNEYIKEFKYNQFEN